jgi:hypothetical protein
MSTNDFAYYQFHKNNGISKLGVNIGNSTQWIIRYTEGLMTLSERINQAFINSIFPDTYILSGQQFMTFKPDLKQDVQRLVNMGGYIIYPLIFTLCLPVFLHNIVMEKESRLLQNMKINGLQMKNYWLNTYLFNQLMYCIVVYFNYFVARYFLEIIMF